MAAPKIIPYDVELRSVNPVRSFDRPKAYTNDLNSVEFQFKVLDMTSTELTTATAVTLVYMRDGSFFANPSTDVSRVGNVFSYLLKENEGNHAGVAQIQLVVTVDGMELASQLFDFEIINGLETKVAQEVMIYDWTTLTRDAQAYIDQFNLNETTRQQQFSDAQAQRTTDFGAAQTQRTTDFNTAEQSRTTVFNAAESARAEGYTADHGRAETDHTTAAADHTTAVTDHTTAAADHTLAASDHTTAAADHTIVQGYNTRLQAEETATANNKISTVKGKTFADVDARIEDVEFDTTLMATNLVTNGDFSSGATGWTAKDSTISASGNVMTNTGTTSGNIPRFEQTLSGIANKNIYIRAVARVTNSACQSLRLNYYSAQSNIIQSVASPIQNQWYTFSTIFKTTYDSVAIFPSHYYVDNITANGKIMEVQYVEAIDLTATFGAGNEPTAEQMDAILAKFPNSWFDGTKNLFQAKASLSKLMALDARTEFEMKNLVVNGDFTRGNPLTDFGTPNAMTVSDKLMVNGTANTYSGKYVDVAAPTGNKLYVSYLITNAGTTTPNITISDYGTYNNQSWPTSTAGLRTSIISSKVNGIRMYIQQVSDVVYNNFTLDNLLVFDLTATFGAGKEPTLAEMDRLMARFPNSWFDGVKPIQTIETLYQEKANKTQEAWITPTLINGWTDIDIANKIRYRKDNFGVVRLDGIGKNGASGQALFVLPIGYRPLNSKIYKSYSAAGGDSVTQVAPTGHVTHWSGSLSGHSVIGIVIDTD